MRAPPTGGADDSAIGARARHARTDVLSRLLGRTRPGGGDAGGAGRGGDGDLPAVRRPLVALKLSDAMLVAMEDTVYEAAGGADGLLQLAGAWHARVLADEVVSHAFSHGYHPQHTERLAAYWAEALGGPSTYSDLYGDETSVVRIHSGNGPHEEMDNRAIACFDQALVDVGLASDERLRQVLHDYFAWATTTTMARYHRSADEVPEGLRITRWSWSGLGDAVGTDDSQ
jgi:hemoglobin